MKQDQSAYLKESLQPFNRRAFLKGSVMAGVGVAAALSLGCSNDGAQNHAYMSNEDAEVLNKLVGVIFPAVDGIYPVANVPMLENINDLLGFVDPGLRGDLSAGIKLFNYGAIILGWHFTTFLDLNAEDALRYVNDWQNGNEIQRGLLSGLKKLIYTAYWRDENTWEAVEFDGPVSDKWGLKSLGNTPMPTN